MIKIYCEGITDQVFIADFLEYHYSKKFNRDSNKKDKNKLNIFIEDEIEIIEIGGCTKLSDALYIADLSDNTEKGGKNIVIFDADYKDKSNGNRGFSSCKQKLNDIIKNKSVHFDFFIWPNNKDDGEIENLLRSLIPNDKECIFDCVMSHQDCLEKLSVENLKKSSLKDMVGYYLYTCNEQSKPIHRNYRDERFWNLNYSESVDLNIFKDFLDSFIDT